MSRRRTFHDVVWIVALLRSVGRLALRATGWRVVGRRPQAPRFVVVAAPHTSAWDLPLMLAVALQVGVPLHWLGLASYFRWPLARLLRWLGGIPVGRGPAADRVRQAADLMAAHDRIAVAIAPEGSRRLVPRWRSGFYHLAVISDVPIVLASLDYARRIATIGPELVPTGDLDADAAVIARFYQGVRGRHPDRQGPIALAPLAPRD